MEIFITIMLFIAAFCFYSAVKIGKKQKEEKKQRNDSQNIGNTYQSSIQSAKSKIYPIFEYQDVNISTQKARREYHNFTVIDFETTGLSSLTEKIIEIGAVKVCDLTITDSFSSLIHPRKKIPPTATRINGITDEMVKNAPYIESILPKLHQFIGDDAIVAHNASFDMKFLIVAASGINMEIKNPVVDTLELCRRLYPNLENHKLGTVAKHLCISFDGAHRSLCDATVTAKILIEGIKELNNRDAIKAQERKRLKEAAKEAAAAKEEISKGI